MYPTADRWAGWAGAGAVLMMVLGVFRAVSGIIALFNDEWIVRGFDGYYFVDIGALGWWMLAIGVLLVAAGWAVIYGRTWGRIVGIVFVVFSMISEFFWLPIYPFWSIMMIVFYAIILYAFMVAREPVT